VLDAPVNTEGQSDVTASRDGNDCLVDVKAHSGAGTGMSGRPLVVRANRDCALVDDGDEKPIDAGNGSAITGGAAVGGSLSFAPMSSGTGGSGTTPLDGRGAAAAPPNAAATEAGCNFTASPRIPYGQGGVAVLSVLGLLGLVRRRRAS
jgi:MYXO-CTERM domain-containing protein